MDDMRLQSLYVPDQNAKLALAELVLAWNNLEAVARALLIRLIGYSPALQATCAEMTAQAVYDAIKAAAPYAVIDTELPYFLRFADGFSLIKDYRNYYVHGATSESRGEEGSSIGIKTESGRAKYIRYEGTVTAVELYKLIGVIGDYALFGVDLWSHLELNRLDRWRGLTDKPELPTALVKHRST